jgi:DNA polymerase-3 subunit delta'
MLDIQGHSRAIAQLQRSLAAGRLASTWLFAGPEGVGKFTAAVGLAKTVMCDMPRQEENRGRVKELPREFMLTVPCGACESCRAMDAGSHPDLHIITKQLIRYHDTSGKSKGTTLSIHVIRGEITGDPAENKEAKIAKRSFRGRGKFFIIDQADLMDWQAQNTLLKTLEEPPPQTYLVLVTTSPGELLSTIRSRSQIVEFGPLPEGVVAEALAGGGGAGLSKEDARLMARLARGSLGRAMRWAQDIQAGADKNAAAAERAEKKKAREGASGEEEEATDKFTPGGILAWTSELAARLDALVAGTGGASEVAAAMAAYAAEYSALQLQRDKLASADRFKRDGIQLLMAIAGEWFADRLRQGLGTPHGTVLPGVTGALDFALVPQLIASAREAEMQIDMNANEKILLAATTTRWEELLREK